MESFAVFLKLLLGTVIYRPYVYAFFVCFLIFALNHLGWRRTLTFLVSTYLVAFACEYSSTRNGFPFGPYTYVDVTRTRELWVSNVPFWDSLSFVFLSYFSFVLSSAVVGVRSRLGPFVGGILMMLLDVVIDPLTLQGDRWFLGHIYDYPYRGFYFGVTAANFAGWFFVGFVSQWLFQRYLELLPWCRGELRGGLPLLTWGAFGVYAGVFGFNLAITLFIGDYRLALASVVVALATLTTLAFFMKRKVSWPSWSVLLQKQKLKRAQKV